ncbi:hypothetical protein [Marinilactibacillus kalidii]|uniref:hypothetical protein n=1 Tax=Marinilactibacillus kalidii TaxID=2820274 RepID=UPI001ABE4D80|nr:hypothetical protein [Marinilactibacillus kalidii]
MKRYTLTALSITGIFLSGCSLEEPTNSTEEPLQLEEQAEQNVEVEDTALPENLEGVALIGVNDSDVAYSYYFANQDLEIFEGNIRGYGTSAYEEKYIETIEDIQVEVEEDQYTITAEDFELNLIKLSNVFMRNIDTGDEYTIE